MVDVEEKPVQGLDPLPQSALQFLPVTGGNYAGDQVEGDKPVRPLVLTIYIESDAESLEQYICFPTFFGDQLLV